jgi:hypothetical protein
VPTASSYVFRLLTTLQPCGSEHPTRENHAPALVLFLRLRIISIQWRNRVLECRIRITEERTAALTEARRIKKLEKKTLKRFRAWRREIVAKKKILFQLCHEYIRTSDPEVAKRFNTVAGMVSYVKMKVMFSSESPRNIWPQHIPYMDVMAWVDWRKEWVAEMRRRMEQDD